MDASPDLNAPEAVVATRAPVWKRLLIPLAVYLVTTGVFVATLQDRALSPSPDNHFVHLSQSFLRGELGVVGNKAPGDNDWALYKGKWFVSFPPFPAVVITPAVAIWGLKTLDRLYWALLAGLAPALLYGLLRSLRERGKTERTHVDDLLLTALFAFGSVFYFVAVQGAVWFAAQVVASSLTILYIWNALDARRPLVAGLCLGLLFATRGPSPVLGGILFLVEAIRMSRSGENLDPRFDESHFLVRVWKWLGGARIGALVKPLALFAIPSIVLAGIMMWLNAKRFDSPFEFGHRYLQIRWLQRIEKWGLFNLHYFSKNLAVATSTLPWFSASDPHIKISRHGVALWVTTPHLLLLLWPKRVDVTMIALYLAAGTIAIMDLCYQNSGWIQFGYRFALDYMPYLIVLLAMSRRKFGPIFVALLVYAIAFNAFGAFTFDRANKYYDDDASQDVLFQRD